MAKTTLAVTISMYQQTLQHLTHFSIVTHGLSLVLKSHGQTIVAPITTIKLTTFIFTPTAHSNLQGIKGEK